MLVLPAPYYVQQAAALGMERPGNDGGAENPTILPRGFYEALVQNYGVKPGDAPGEFGFLFH